MLVCVCSVRKSVFDIGGSTNLDVCVPRVFLFAVESFRLSLIYCIPVQCLFSLLVASEHIRETQVSFV